MLVIMRRKSEKIICTVIEDISKGEKIEIMVTDIDGKQTCLGIEAPRSIDIQRAELIKVKNND